MGLQRKLQNLQRIKDAGGFSKYIEHLRYPRFKNMEPNSRIDFTFPITFLVGKNGSGKSSILHSLYGSPSNKNIGDYWFETATDPIIENEFRNRYIYGYKINGIVNEVLYQRAPRDGNPDYWETARPLRSLGMPNEIRVNPIEMTVEYLDFRSELNAFDKFFYFLEYNGDRFSRKQDFLRFFSKKLKRAFENNSIERYYKQKNERKVVISQNLATKISTILGKSYSTIEIIKHNFFKDWGYSIKVTSENKSYTEAFSGSGESAVILLLYKISLLPDNSLIILDEPETSLHPGAQRRLIEYLIDLSIARKHQIVISTHSPDIIEEMPENSIKTIYTTENNKFDISDAQNFNLAFIELDKLSHIKKTILYEDTLVGKICNTVLSNINPDYKRVLDLQISSGGSKEIFKRIAHIMDLPSDIIIIFDGDQRRDDVMIETNSFTVQQSTDITFLKQKVMDKTDVEIKFSLDGGNAANNEQNIAKHTQYLDFINDKVKYFPLDIPEDIIWDELYAKEKVKSLLGENNYIPTGANSKEKFVNLCRKLFDSTSNYELLIDEFIVKWKAKRDDNYVEIEGMLNAIL